MSVEILSPLLVRSPSMPVENGWRNSMSSDITTSSRLDRRLDDLPTDPEDPESLSELVVVAFAALDRYYLCWKNRAGEYRQESQGLPQMLQEWLFPSTGGLRDLATLQVVLGHGDEFFASDSNGKISNVDQEIREKIPRTESSLDTARSERQALRRSRTFSLVRPSSGADMKPINTTMETQERGNLPQLSDIDPNQTTHSIESPMHRNATRHGELDLKPVSQPVEPLRRPTVMRLERQRARPRSMTFAPTFALQQYSERETLARKECTCPCGCNPSRQMPRSNYIDASVQTDTETLIAYPELEHDTASLSSESSASGGTGLSTPATANTANPVAMGKMQDYFRANSYQLGDALCSAYGIGQTYSQFGSWSSYWDRRRTV